MPTTKTSLGQYLLNDVFPKGHQITEPLTKSALTKRLLAMAREDPVKYVETVNNLKKLGDDFGYQGPDEFEKFWREDFEAFKKLAVKFK